jgi:hypothetical protein
LGGQRYSSPVSNLQPGPDYNLYFFPPAGWRITSDNPHSAHVIAESGGGLGISAEPGDATPPTLPTQPAECAPPADQAPVDVTPQARAVAGGLASTGASVIGLSALGAVALLLGVGIVIMGRRRLTV